MQGPVLILPRIRTHYICLLRQCLLAKQHDHWSNLECSLAHAPLFTPEMLQAHTPYPFHLPCAVCFITSVVSCALEAERRQRLERLGGGLGAQRPTSASDVGDDAPEMRASRPPKHDAQDDFSKAATSISGTPLRRRIAPSRVGGTSQQSVSGVTAKSADIAGISDDNSTAAEGLLQQPLTRAVTTPMVTKDPIRLGAQGSVDSLVSEVTPTEKVGLPTCVLPPPDFVSDLVAV